MLHLLSILAIIDLHYLLFCQATLIIFKRGFVRRASAITLLVIAYIYKYKIKCLQLLDFIT